MRRFDTPYIYDWIAISLRWMTLIGLVATLALTGTVEPQAYEVLGVMVVWNLLMTAMASVYARLQFHRPLNVIVDLTLTAALFWAQGGLDGPVWWAGIYSILTASIYYEFRGGLAAAGFSILLFVIQYLPGGGEVQSSPMAPIGLMLLLGLLFGPLGRLLVLRIGRQRKLWLDAEEKRHRVQTERLRAIYELTSTLATTLSYRRVLDSALDLAYSALTGDPYEVADDHLVGAILLFRSGVLRTGSARRFTNSDLRVTFAGNEGILKKLFDEGEPMLTRDLGYDPELGRVIALRNCTVGYFFPLRSGFNVYGVMLFAHSEPNYFSAERRNLLDIIGRQAVIAIQNARLYQDLVEEKERMIEVHEEARKKLARDLHDGPTQSVSAMAMQINVARRMLTKDPRAAGEQLSHVEELAYRTTKEIRHMLFTLRPLILESQGLQAALQAMADKMRETFSQEVSIDIDERIASQMELGKQGVVFYIVEEAVNNARKHADAANIWVRLKPFETNMALLEIVDNGLGFDVEAMNRAYDKRGSLGMINLRERAELVNGLLNVNSALGQGTTVQVYIPFTEESAEHLLLARKK
ncbi:MAG: histidine kinase [Bacteroidota bacterium]